MVLKKNNMDINCFTKNIYFRIWWYNLILIKVKIHICILLRRGIFSLKDVFILFVILNLSRLICISISEIFKTNVSNRFSSRCESQRLFFVKKLVWNVCINAFCYRKIYLCSISDFFKSLENCFLKFEFTKIKVQ